MTMNKLTKEEIEYAMYKEWREWHSYLEDEDDVPRINPSFRKGFLDGIKFAQDMADKNDEDEIPM